MLTNCDDCAKKAPCQKCEDEAITNYISQAKRDAKAKGISGEIVILSRINNTGFFWVTRDDERVERLRVVERLWID